MRTTTLRELLGANGPYASVYFEDSHETADAAKQQELKWRELRENLAGQGADEPTLDAMGEAVLDGSPAVGRSGRALVAANGQVLLDRHLPAPPQETVARWSSLPYLLPLVEHGEPAPVHVIAIADSVGADLTALDQDGAVIGEHSTEGHDHPVHAASHAGETRRHMEERVDEYVKHNLRLVAEDTAKLAKRVGAELVVLAGEVQARSTLHDELPEPARGMAVQVEAGGRDEGASGEELGKRVRELLDRARKSTVDDAVERFAAESGRDAGLAVQGLQAVTTALREGNVATLLAGRPAEQTVFTGPRPEQLGMQEEELTGFGIEPEGRCSADEALPAAAIVTGADIVGVGDRIELVEGFGAVLRHG